MAEAGKWRIGIIGSGALGLYFGIRLVAAGHEVTFLVRSDHAAIADGGLCLQLADGQEVRVERPRIVTQASEMGEQDWVVVALKTTQNAALASLLPPVVGRRTRLLTLQNGIGNVEQLEAICGGVPILAGLCQIGVNREGPGKVRNFVPDNGFVQIGQVFESGAEDMREALAAVLEAAGIRSRVTPSLGEALWRKLMWNVPFNGLTVEAGGTGTDVICADPSWRARARALMEEIRLASEALGFPIESSYTDRLLEFTDKIGAYRPSSVLDWLACRPLEIEAIYAKPLRAGTAAGVKMPELERLTRVLERLDYAPR
jgi:2-dehydropantoate 2-reductase